MWHHIKSILQVILLVYTSFLSPHSGIEKYNHMSQNFLSISYHYTELQPSDKNIGTRTRLKF